MFYSSFFFIFFPDNHFRNFKIVVAAEPITRQPNIQIHTNTQTLTHTHAHIRNRARKYTYAYAQRNTR